MSVDPEAPQHDSGPRVVLAILATATLASFLGIGGGVVYVPVLVAMAGVDERAARGTSLGLIFGVVTVAFLSAWLWSGVEPRWWIAAVVVPFAILMTHVAAGWLRHLPLRLLAAVFVGVLLLVSLRLLTSLPPVAAALGLEGVAGGLMPCEPGLPALVVLAGIGLAVGVIGPLAGIGGGLLLLPLLDLFFVDLDLATVRATSLLIVWPTAGMGFRAALRHGVAHADLWRRLVVPAAAGAVLGSWLVDVLPRDALRGAFGCFLFIVALHRLRTLVRNRQNPG
ncbi:MAG: sulfite exporter TauE/SafE family protein [Planctomycetota bacterium]